MTTITRAASFLQVDRRFALPIAWAIDLELGLRPPAPQKFVSAGPVESLAATLGAISASTEPEKIEATKLLAQAILKLKPGVPTTEEKDLTPIWSSAKAVLDRKAAAPH